VAGNAGDLAFAGLELCGPAEPEIDAVAQIPGSGRSIPIRLAGETALGGHRADQGQDENPAGYIHEVPA
jgi:hypothetical protein